MLETEHSNGLSENDFLKIIEKVDLEYRPHLTILLEQVKALYPAPEAQKQCIEKAIMRGRMTDVLCRLTGQSNALTQWAYSDEFVPNNDWENRATWPISDIISTYVQSSVGTKQGIGGVHIRHGAILLHEGQLEGLAASLHLTLSKETDYRALETFISACETFLYWQTDSYTGLNDTEYNSANTFFRLILDCVNGKPISRVMPARVYATLSS